LLDAFDAVESARGETSLTYFEFGTLAALWILSRADLDYAVMEVGLGGRLDAVNLLDADCSVITAIGLDHQEYLGPDLLSIGREKAGIIRPSTPVICGEADPPASVLEIAASLAAPVKIGTRRQPVKMRPVFLTLAIIENAQEFSVFMSAPGKGAVFSIYLPLSGGGEDAGRPQSAAPEEESKRGAGTILFVEGESEGGDLISTTLDGFGYRVIEAADGADAAEKLRGLDDGIDLLLIDMKSSDAGVFSESREMLAMSWGKAKVIVMSGDPSRLKRDYPFMSPGVVLLKKPVSPTDLLKMVKEVIDG